MTNQIISSAECKIIITVKNGLVHVEGNPATVDLARLMLCSAIGAIEKMFLDRQQRQIVKPEGLRLTQ